MVLSLGFWRDTEPSGNNSPDRVRVSPLFPNQDRMSIPGTTAVRTFSQDHRHLLHHVGADLGLGFRIWNVGFRVSDKFRLQTSVYGSGGEGLGFRVHGSGLSNKSLRSPNQLGGLRDVFLSVVAENRVI